MFSRIKKSGNDIYDLGLDLMNYGKDRLMEKILQRLKVLGKKQSSQSTASEKTRKNMERNFVIPERDDAELLAQQQSMLNSQGVPYKGPGNAGEKTSSNMSQRNYENHRGN